jgi:hypothetical protein
MPPRGWKKAKINPTPSDMLRKIERARKQIRSKSLLWIRVKMQLDEKGFDEESRKLVAYYEEKFPGGVVRPVADLVEEESARARAGPLDDALCQRVCRFRKDVRDQVFVESRAAARTLFDLEQAGRFELAERLAQSWNDGLEDLYRDERMPDGAYTICSPRKRALDTWRDRLEFGDDLRVPLEKLEKSFGVHLGDFDFVERFPWPRSDAERIVTLCEGTHLRGCDLNELYGNV